MPAQKVQQTPQDKALVTFIRATNFGGAIDFGLWDGENVVGVIDPKTYIQYETTPGEHIFMAHAENWSVVKATLEAGKHYYVLANVSMGVWKARVILRPIKTNDHEYSQKNMDEWNTNLKPTTPDPMKIEEYRTPRLEDVRAALANVNSGKAEFSVLEVGDVYN